MKSRVPSGREPPLAEPFEGLELYNENLSRTVLRRGLDCKAQLLSGWLSLLNQKFPNDNIVLVYNWVWESDDPNYGWLTGAADNLLASLHSNPASLTNSAGLNFITDRKMHFIGHSRGAILNFETVKLIKYYYPGDPIDQVTSIDPHPATYTRDPGFGRALVFGKINPLVGNVTFADNYYRTDFGYEIDGDFDGVNIKGAYNVKLDEDILNIGGYTFEHSDAHLWYHGTVNISPGAFDGKETVPANWYPSGTRYGPRESVGFYYAFKDSRPKPDEVIEDKTVTLDYSIFNGDFDYSNKIGSQIPGWERHGGGGTGHLGRYDNIILNPHMELDWHNNELTHNYFFIPQDANKIYFRFKVNNASFNDKVNIYLGETLIAIRNLFWRSLYKWDEIIIPTEMLGTSQTLSYKIDGSGTVTSEVWVDDIGFEKNANLIASILSYVGILQKSIAIATKTNNENIPVQLHAYDHLGRHTGAITDSTWEANIPGSEYSVNVDPLGEAYTQILVPASEFDYRFEVISLEDNTPCTFMLEDFTKESTTNIIFDEINLAANGTAQLTFSATATAVNLAVDYDGDGTIDETQAPVSINQNYAVIASADGNGVISPADTIYIANGEDIIFTITPNENYKIADIKVDNISVGALSEYTFSTIDSSHTISAEFSQITGLENNEVLPKKYQLNQNYPNPFNPTTQISFDLLKKSKVKLSVYNLLGKRIAVLIDEIKNAGPHAVSWDASDLASGVYMYRLEADGFVQTRKMILLQ